MKPRQILSAGKPCSWPQGCQLEGIIYVFTAARIMQELETQELSAGLSAGLEAQLPGGSGLTGVPGTAPVLRTPITWDGRHASGKAAALH